MTIVDVQFQLQGDQIPADHGYYLFSSITNLIPELHGDKEIGVFPISGKPTHYRTLILNESSRLAFRLPSNRVPLVINLAGKRIEVGGYGLIVGLPSIRALIPCERVYSRLVTIKGFLDPEPFFDAAVRQLQRMNVNGEPYLIEQKEIAQANIGRNGGTHSDYLRRTLRIRGKEVVGFAMGVRGLNDSGSVELQEQGIGGRRRYGCGLFMHDRGND